MCHSTDSRPPGPPNPGPVAEHGALTLTSADGTEFPGFFAIPRRSNGANVVVLPDRRGAHPFYQALAQRFAEAGYGTVVIDYFGRTAASADRGDDFDWQANLSRVTPDQVRHDVQAGIEYLRGREQRGPIFTVGFCFGGGHSWRLAASDLDLAGVIGFYGLPRTVRDVLGELSKPMLLLVAGDDAATPTEEANTFADELAAAGADVERYVYDGAPHSFFDASFDEWRDACADAWRRILDFTARHAVTS